MRGPFPNFFLYLFISLHGNTSHAFMYCCSNITDGIIRHEALWGLARAHRRGLASQPLFWLKGLARLPRGGDSYVTWGVAPRSQNINLTKPEPSKPRLPSSQIVPSSFSFSVKEAGSGCMEINFELSSKGVAPISVFRPAQPLLMSSPPVSPFFCGRSVAEIQH